jgi:hypothetical protein
MFSAALHSKRMTIVARMLCNDKDRKLHLPLLSDRSLARNKGL